MKRTSTNETRILGLSRACVAGGRTFVIFAALLILVMPLTEYYWTFDKFLRGGQDMEFGLLSLAAIFCLILVLSQQRMQKVVSLFLAARQWLWLSLQRSRRFVRESLEGIPVASDAAPPCHSVLASFTPPLQI